MKNQQTAIFHTLPDEEFVDRKDEIEKIYRLALGSLDNATQSIYFCGNRKTGKTEVLKRVYHRLFWEQDRIIPFYFPFNKEFSDTLVFSKSYLTEFVKMGVIKRVPNDFGNNSYNFILFDYELVKILLAPLFKIV